MEFYTLKSYLRISFDGQPSELMPLKKAILERIEFLRRESVLSHNLGEEDSVDKVNVLLCEYEDGTVVLAVKADVESTMTPLEIEKAIEKSLVDELNESKAGGCFADAVGDNNGISLISPIITYVTNDEENLLCHACGGMFIVDENGVSTHVDADLNTLFDDNLDHAPH
ncbi:hypothetical protein [Vibrio crassostreae]|uniref:hypothetical protein n=1 Tax=Vibrio crassostreae TaxID=246167 RepID=UPI001B313306|nr:hypothetical protein [Vibrio crassostreae]